MLYTFCYYLIFLTLGYIYFLQPSFCDLNTLFSRQGRNLTSREVLIQPRIFSQMSLQGLMTFMRFTQLIRWPTVNWVMAIKQF